ncbi:MAG: DegT/DnrJ/EryC1/StrS family aminotransferase [Thermodesulfobacteriota bacterium]
MNKIRLSKSVVGALEKKKLSEVIDQGYLGMGVFVKEFEGKLRTYLEAKHVICVNSGTAALHLALMGLGLKREEEVLVPSLTYVATFQAIKAAGLRPVPCEIVPETCTINLKDAEKKITSKTKVIMPVHYASRTGNLNEVYEFAKRYHFRVIEDAAHAFGNIYEGKKIGSLGDITCFSFDGIKNITSGEGGTVVTSDDEVAQFVKDARLLGVQNDTEKRYQSQRSWEFDVTHQGYRYHMSNIFAAIGIVQLERFEKEFRPARQRLAKKYHKALQGIKDLSLFSGGYDKIVPHIFPVRILKERRDGLRQHLIDHNIECGVHYYPNHLLTYYGAQKGKLPVTEQIYSELLSIPLHPDVTEDDQERVIKCIESWLNK